MDGSIFKFELNGFSSSSGNFDHCVFGRPLDQKQGKGVVQMSDLKHLQKEGKMTSEHDVAKAASLWSKVAMILGAVITTAGPWIDSQLASGNNSAWLIIAGAVIALFALVKDTLMNLGYIKSRTDVKVAEGRVLEAKEAAVKAFQEKQVK